MNKKYLSIFFILMTAFSWNVYSQNNSEVSAKYEELEIAAKWILKHNKGVEDADLMAKLMTYPNRLLPLGKTYLDPLGKPNRVEFQIYIVARTKDHLVYLTSESGKIKIVIGAPVSEQTYNAAVRNSAYLLLEPPNSEPIFNNLLKILVASSQYAKSGYPQEPLVYGEDAFNREVSKIGNYVTIPFNLVEGISVEQLSDFLLVLWMTSEKGINIDLLKPEVEKTCSQYLTGE